MREGHRSPVESSAWWVRPRLHEYEAAVLKQGVSKIQVRSTDTELCVGFFFVSKRFLLTDLSL